MPGPADLLAAIQAKQSKAAAAADVPSPPAHHLAAALQKRHSADAPPFEKPNLKSSSTTTSTTPVHTGTGAFTFDESLQAFLFFRANQGVQDFVPTVREEEEEETSTSSTTTTTTSTIMVPWHRVCIVCVITRLPKRNPSHCIDVY